MKRKFLTQSGMAILIIIALMIPIFLKEDQVEISAQKVSFNGIKDLIEKSTEEDPFTIVELVPEESYAKMGYLVKGEEPVKWDEVLISKKTYEERKQWMEGIKNDFSEISKPDDHAVFKDLGDYEEKYVLSSEEEATGKWKEYKLSEEVLLNKGEKKFRMKEKTSGSKGYYKIEETFTLVGDGETGGYSPNIDFYQYENSHKGKFSIKFKKSDKTVEELKSEKAYRVLKTEVIRSGEDLNGFSSEVSIYEKKMEEISGKQTDIYEFKAKKSEFNETDFSENGEYKYFLVKFVNADVSYLNEHQDDTYYEMDGNPISLTEPIGEYMAVLKVGEEYVLDPNGKFKRTVGDAYTYVRNGTGNYNLERVADPNETGNIGLNANVKFQYFFAKGGYQNNDLLKKNVFFDAADYENWKDKMKIRVIPMKPDKFNQYIKEGGEVNLLYISTSRLPVTNTSTASATFSSSNDIDDDTYRVLKNYLSLKSDGGEELPLIVEPSLNRSELDSTNIKKLFTNFNLQDPTYNGKEVVKNNILLLKENISEKAPALLVDFTKEIVSDSSENDFEQKADALLLGDVARQIISDNTEKDIAESISNARPLFINRAVLVEYIISYAMKRIRTTDQVVRVLNIEPAPVFTENYKEKQEERVKKWLEGTNYELQNVEVTTIPTIEFVGRVLELTDYDMIFMGLDTSSFYTDSSGKTVYNDSKMNGLIYSNIGDMATFVQRNLNNHAGLLDTDYLSFKSYLSLLQSNSAKKEESEYFKALLGVDFQNKDDYHVVDNGKLNLKEKVNGREFTTFHAQSKINYSMPAEKEVDGKKTLFANREAPNTYRYSGNDITEENERRLQEYMNAGFPIVLADGFLKSDGSVLKVDEDKIDNCSRVYDLIHKNIKSGQIKKNIFFEKKDGENYKIYNVSKNQVGSTIFYTMLNASKPEIEFTEATERITDPEGRPSVYTKVENKTLVIKFKLNNKGILDSKLKFRADFYIDINADGKFSATTEMVDPRELVIRRGSNHSSRVNFDELTASDGTLYVLQYALPEGFVGSVPWKLKISLGNNENKYTTLIGYGYVKSEKGKQQVNILQVRSNAYPYSRIVYLKKKKEAHEKDHSKPDLSTWELAEYNKFKDQFSTEQEVENAFKAATEYVDRKNDLFYQRVYSHLNWYNTINNFDMAAELQNPRSSFKKLVDKVEDYEINVVSVSAEEFAEFYKKYHEANPSGAASPETNPYPEGVFDDMDNFRDRDKKNDNKAVDMVVLGFADCYAIPNEHGCLRALQGFIQDGKPTLFTHDCTSFINYVRTNPWGYDFNKMIRNFVGLDRFGIEDNWALRVGKSLKKGDSTVLNKDVYPTLRKKVGADITNGALFEKAVELSVQNRKSIKDIAYEPKSGKKVISKHAQGFSNGTIGNYLPKDAHSNDLKNSQQFVFKGSKSNLAKVTNGISKVNSGQITNYPFVIKDDFKIADTHFQPYQIDFNEDVDEDGENDLIVWFTLNNTDRNGELFKSNSSFYKYFPKDVRNNYYIYTKGNITYSGVGHSRITDEEEMKLYINTMIAAYNGAVAPPKIEFRDGLEENAREKYVSYISVNDTGDSNTEENIDEKVDVYYNIKDNNIVRNLHHKNILVQCKIKAKGDTEFSDFTLPLSISSKDVKGQTWYVLNDGDTNTLEIPLSKLNFSGNYIDLKIIAKTEINRKKIDGTVKDKPDYTQSTEKVYRIQKRGLFDLD